MKITEMSLGERPRERLIAEGAGALSNSELLAVILRSGTSKTNVLELSRSIIENCEGRLTELSKYSFKELCQISGIGPGKASVLAASFELGRRFMSESIDKKLPLTNSEMVYKLMIPKLKGLRHEECYIICLSATHKVNGIHLIGRGTEDSVLFEPRDAIKKAFENGSKALILTHNHPGGNPLPSKADIERTNTLSKACLACDLVLLDHIIVSDDKYYSFADEKVYCPGICKE